MQTFALAPLANRQFPGADSIIPCGNEGTNISLSEAVGTCSVVINIVA